jgi:hypothetical protein
VYISPVTGLRFLFDKGLGNKQILHGDLRLYPETGMVMGHPEAVMAAL